MSKEAMMTRTEFLSAASAFAAAPFKLGAVSSPGDAPNPDVAPSPVSSPNVPFPK